MDSWVAQPLTRESIERAFRELKRPEKLVACPACHGEASFPKRWCNLCQWDGNQVAVMGDDGEWVYRNFVKAGDDGEIYRVLVDQGGE